MPVDVIVPSVSFSSTTITARAATAAGLEFFAAHFGAGVTSVTLPKSQLERFAQAARAAGLALR